MVSRFFVFAAAAALLLATASGAAHAADADGDQPWVVTRKADNRVLPKQDTVEDIESGRARPDAPQQPETGPETTTDTAAENGADTAEPVPAARAQTAPEQASGSVGRLSFDISAARILVSVPTSALVTDTRYLNLDDPRRLAVDVMGRWSYKGPSVYRFDDGAAKHAVVGVHPDFLRVVLHLTEAPVPASIDPVVEMVEGGLSVTVPLGR